MWPSQQSTFQHSWNNNTDRRRSGEISRKRLELLDERNKQVLKRKREERGAYLANQMGNRKEAKIEETEVESQDQEV